MMYSPTPPSAHDISHPELVSQIRALGAQHGLCESCSDPERVLLEGDSAVVLKLGNESIVLRGKFDQVAPQLEELVSASYCVHLSYNKAEIHGHVIRHSINQPISGSILRLAMSSKELTKSPSEAVRIYVFEGYVNDDPNDDKITVSELIRTHSGADMRDFIYLDPHSTNCLTFWDEKYFLAKCAKWNPLVADFRAAA